MEMSLNKFFPLSAKTVKGLRLLFNVNTNINNFVLHLICFLLSYDFFCKNNLYKDSYNTTTNWNTVVCSLWELM